MHSIALSVANLAKGKFERKSSKMSVIAKSDLVVAIGTFIQNFWINFSKALVSERLANF